jgi:hypothetical protein
LTKSLVYLNIVISLGCQALNHLALNKEFQQTFKNSNMIVLKQKSNQSLTEC